MRSIIYVYIFIAHNCNEVLDPRMRLSRIDLDDEVDLKTFHTDKKKQNEQRRIVIEPDDPEVLMRKIKNLRRIEYWKRRVKNDILKHSRSYSSHEKTL